MGAAVVKVAVEMMVAVAIVVVEVTQVDRMVQWTKRTPCTEAQHHQAWLAVQPGAQKTMAQSQTRLTAVFALLTVMVGTTGMVPL